MKTMTPENYTENPADSPRPKLTFPVDVAKLTFLVDIAKLTFSADVALTLQN